jgi:hypothetical protein
MNVSSTSPRRARLLFDAADGLVEQIRSRGRKGSLAALRDAVVLKTTYAYGLRRRETVMLDEADCRRNPRDLGKRRQRIPPGSNIATDQLVKLQWSRLGSHGSVINMRNALQDQTFPNIVVEE